MLYLMEMFGLGYVDVMSMPWSRRKRLVEEKQQLEKRRANIQNAERGRRRVGR
jgi:hypothetical protein